MIMTKISDDMDIFFQRHTYTDMHAQTHTRTYSQMPVKIILIPKLNPFFIIHVSETLIHQQRIEV